MGRKLNVSQPVVVNTELNPLDIVFTLIANGSLEQWYYDNTSDWQPNRRRTPLLVTPSISGIDTETNTRYTPTFYTVKWYANEYRTNGWVESQITNTTDGDVDYVVVGNNLKIKKNVNYDRAVQIRCVATYIDPRDSGKTGTVEKILTLNCSKDANVDSPAIDILCETDLPYNPLTRGSSVFALEAVAHLGARDITNEIYWMWYAVVNGQEVLVETQPFYVSGQHTKTIRVDALYSEEIKLVARAKETSSSANLYAAKAYRSVVWRIPDIDSNVVCKNGQSYRSSIKIMEFSTIINVRGKILSDEVKERHMKFNWKTRQSRNSTEVDRGWGLSVRLDNSALQSTQGSVLVYPDIYILGAAEPVTHNGAAVTHNGVAVYHQFV